MSLARRNRGRLRTGNYRRLKHEELEQRRLLAVVTVDTLDDSIDFNDGVTSLREAIFATNTVPGLDTIDFDAALTASGPATILLTQGELAITDSLTITGSTVNWITIDASGNDADVNVPGNGSRIFNIDDHSDLAIDVNLSSLILTGGDTPAAGGAIFSSERLVADYLFVLGNRAGSGGGMLLSGASSTVKNSGFSENASAGGGGGVILESAPAGSVFTFSHTHFAGNSANRGGAIATGRISTDFTLLVDYGDFHANKASTEGGALYLSSAGNFSEVTVQSSYFDGNTAGFAGAGILLRGVRDFALVDGSMFSNRTLSTGQGGALFAMESDLAITGTYFGENEAITGGAIYSRGSELAINFAHFEKNKATGGHGGAVFSQNDRLTLVGSVITGNSAVGVVSNAGKGGGLYHSPGASFPSSITDTVFSGNSAGNDGGGAYIGPGAQSLGSVAFNDATFTGNSANRGGGIATGPSGAGPQASGLAIQGGTIVDNTAVMSGGGIYNRLSGLTLLGTTISGNRAGGNGGGGVAQAQLGAPIAVNILGAAFRQNVAEVVRGRGSADGGGLWIPGIANVQIVDSEFRDNRASNGGGIYRRAEGTAGNMSFTRSTVSGNSALVSGGGIYNQAGRLSVNSSIVSNNTATNGVGGGILNRNADLAIQTSSLVGNHATTGRGGGLYHQQGDLTIASSTISGNMANKDGGGVMVMTSPPTDRNLILSSTISGNSSLRTGGLYLRGDTTIRNSTVTGNVGGFGGAGGIVAGDGSTRLELDHTIVAKNSFVGEGSVPTDIRLILNLGNVVMRSSLIGDSNGTALVEAPLGSPDLNGNLIGKSAAAGGSGTIDPLLGPLAANGGPTQTHALLPLSPAIDAGALVHNDPLGFDQRGNPFSRMVDGSGDGKRRIDMGAYESQGVPHFTPGDFNLDGLVDACDFTIWRNTLGSTVVPFSGADGDGDGIIDEDDYVIWKAHFGQGLILTTNAVGAGALAVAITVVEPSRSLTAPVNLLAAQPPSPPGVIRAANSQLRKSTEHAAQITDNLLAWWSTRSPLATGSSAVEPNDSAGDTRVVDSQSAMSGLDLAFAALGE